MLAVTITYPNHGLAFNISDKSMDEALPTYTKSITVNHCVSPNVFAETHTLFSLCSFGPCILGVEYCRKQQEKTEPGQAGRVRW